jgi:AbrB family looped-hinge helix DNA binding protein
MTTVTAKGQVTIPKPVRERLGITPGSSVHFELTEDGRVVLTRVVLTRVVLTKASMAPAKRRFAQFVGIAGPGMTTDEIMAMTRGED